MTSNNINIMFSPQYQSKFDANYGQRISSTCVGTEPCPDATREQESILSTRPSADQWASISPTSASGGVREIVSSINLPNKATAAKNHRSHKREVIGSGARIPKGLIKKRFTALHTHHTGKGCFCIRFEDDT